MRALIWAGIFQALTTIGFACSMFSAPAPAVVVATAECEHYLEVLRSEKVSGATCAEGKAAAEKAEPACHLEFTCPTGGPDADAGKDR